MERDKRYIKIYKSMLYLPVAARPKQFLANLVIGARYRYVDRLAKEQQDALYMIDLLDEGVFVDGLGGWTQFFVWKSCVRYFRKGYVINC
jgi:hypothetical protein